MTATPQDAGPAVKARGLTKRYGDRLAVDGLDFELPTGVVSGFVGPNGAGKTTTIRMLLGLSAPTSGSGSVLGHPITHPAAFLPKVGAMIEGPAFYPALSGARNLEVLAALGGIDAERTGIVLARVGLDERGRDLFRTYRWG